MSHHVACPYCQSLLLVPANCAGRATKCPQCSGSFLIPDVVVAVPAGNPAAPSAPVVPNLATPASLPIAPAEPPPVTEAQVHRAEEIYQQLATENIALQVELAKRQRRARRLATVVTWLRRFQAGRKRLDHSTGRVGGYFPAITLATVLWVMVVTSLVSLGGFGFFTVICLGLIASTVAYMPFSYYPDDARLATLLHQRQAKLAEAQQAADTLAMEEAAQRARLDQAEQEFQTLKRALASRMQWLRTVQWQQLNTKSLVTLLTQVFEEHGYSVEPDRKKSSGRHRPDRDARQETRGCAGERSPGRTH